jgi:hypothetical protein
MAAQNVAQPLKIGTVVRIVKSGYGYVRIAEDRGNLGPNGIRIYRVRVQKKPRPVYIEVREDQLEVVNPV